MVQLKSRPVSALTESAHVRRGARHWKRDRRQVAAVARYAAARYAVAVGAGEMPFWSNFQGICKSYSCHLTAQEHHPTPDSGNRSSEKDTILESTRVRRA